MTDAQQIVISSIPPRITPSEVLTLLKKGAFSPIYLEYLKSYSGYTDDIISYWLNINVKTYRSYKTSKVEIKEDIKEHTILLLALMRHGLEVFGSIDDFKVWLELENYYLDNQKPYEFLNTISGIKFIDNRITAMAYGDNV